MEKIFSFIPLAMQLFFAGSLLWLLFFYLFFRKRFSKKSPAITFLNFPINRKMDDCFAIYYKDKILIQFDNIIAYCGFLLSFQNSLNEICDNKDYISLEEFDDFAKKIGVSYVSFTADAVQFSSIHFPGYTNKFSNTYREIYCKFSPESAKFFFNYVSNPKLSFGLLLLYLSTAVRDDVHFINKNKEYGLQYLDLYCHSFIRHKEDLLNVWYGLISINSQKYFDNEYNNLNQFNKLLIYFTNCILEDLNIEISLRDKLYLYYFLLKRRISALKKII